MKADDAEVARLRRELAKTRMERDILKNAIAYFTKDQNSIHLVRGDLVHGLRAMVRNVDADLPQHGDGLGAHAGGVTPLTTLWCLTEQATGRWPRPSGCGPVRDAEDENSLHAEAFAP
jgi:hypothetical protein